MWRVRWNDASGQAKERLIVGMHSDALRDLAGKWREKREADDRLSGPEQRALRALHHVLSRPRDSYWVPARSDPFADLLEILAELHQDGHRCYRREVQALEQGLFLLKCLSPARFAEGWAELGEE